ARAGQWSKRCWWPPAEAGLRGRPPVRRQPQLTMLNVLKLWQPPKLSVLTPSVYAVSGVPRLCRSRMALWSPPSGRGDGTSAVAEAVLLPDRLAVQQERQERRPGVEGRGQGQQDAGRTSGEIHRQPDELVAGKRQVAAVADRVPGQP